MLLDSEYEFEADNYFLIHPILEWFRLQLQGRSSTNQQFEPISENEIVEGAAFLQNAISLAGVTRIAQHVTGREFAEAQQLWVRAAKMLRSNLDALSEEIFRTLPQERGEPVIAVGRLAMAGACYLVKFGQIEFADRIISLFENFRASSGSEKGAFQKQLSPILQGFKYAEFRQKMADFSDNFE